MPRKKKRNANGSHTIYYVENKKHWQGQICIGFKEDGRPNRKSVYGKTRKEVADKIKQIEYGIHTGTFTDKSEITIYHLAKQMIDESYNLNEIKDSTYFRHLSTLKGLEPLCKRQRSCSSRTLCSSRFGIHNRPSTSCIRCSRRPLRKR